MLLAFVAYATYRAFSGQYYFAEPYLTPFLLAVRHHRVRRRLLPPGHLGGRLVAVLTPAVLILVIPLSLRLTCYYYRKAYYRSFWMSPPACSVAEPHRRYTGETRFPLILQNIHRYCAVRGAGVNVIACLRRGDEPCRAERRGGTWAWAR